MTVVDVWLNPSTPDDAGSRLFLIGHCHMKEDPTSKLPPWEPPILLNFECDAQLAPINDFTVTRISSFAVPIPVA